MCMMLAMNFLGHFALGYFAAVLSSRITREEFFLPLVLMLSILPDVDVFILGLEHRGPSHSLVLALALFLPFFIMHGRGFPYFAALASHSLIGDYLTNRGCQMFWPLSSEWFVSSVAFNTGPITMGLELSLFALMVGSQLTGLRVKLTRFTRNPRAPQISKGAADHGPPERMD